MDSGTIMTHITCKSNRSYLINVNNTFCQFYLRKRDELLPRIFFVFKSRSELKADGGK